MATHQIMYRKMYVVGLDSFIIDYFRLGLLPSLFYEACHSYARSSQGVFFYLCVDTEMQGLTFCDMQCAHELLYI